MARERVSLTRKSLAKFLEVEFATTRLRQISKEKVEIAEAAGELVALLDKEPDRWDA